MEEGQINDTLEPPYLHVKLSHLGGSSSNFLKQNRKIKFHNPFAYLESLFTYLIFVMPNET